MKTKIKNKFYSIFTIFDIKNIVYLIICSVALCVLSFLSTTKDYGFDYNLVFNLNHDIYLVILILSVTFFSYNVVNRLKNKVEYLVRFESKENYYSFILKRVLEVALVVYLINVITLIISRFIIHSFILCDTLYFYYDINCSAYYIWQIIRNGIYLCYVEYIFSYLSLYTRNEYSKYLFLLVVVINILIPIATYFESSIIRLFSFASYINYYDFTSFIREILYCLSSTAVKGFIITEICTFIGKVNINNHWINLKRVLSFIKTMLVPLLIYSIINIINVKINLNTSGLPPEKSLIPLISFKELDFLTFATKCLSVLAVMYIVAKSISIDLDKNYSFLFTRISKKKWLIKKFFSLVIFALILRLPLYIYAEFPSVVIIDMLMYLIVIIYMFIYLLSKANIGLVLLLVNVVLLFYLELNFKYSIILFIFALIVSFIYGFFYKK